MTQLLNIFIFYTKTVKSSKVMKALHKIKGRCHTKYEVEQLTVLNPMVSGPPTQTKDAWVQRLLSFN